jgi:hypothetical protein
MALPGARLVLGGQPQSRPQAAKSLSIFHDPCFLYTFESILSCMENRQWDIRGRMETWEWPHNLIRLMARGPRKGTHPRDDDHYLPRHRRPLPRDSDPQKLLLGPKKDLM